MNLVSYGTALVLIAAAPGPVVTILLARTLSGNVRAAAAFATGVVLGKLVIMAAVAGGLILWLGDAGGVLAAVKGLGLIYLLWIDLRLWQGIEASPVGVAGSLKGYGCAEVGAGLAMSLSSPFSLVFFLAVLPVADLAPAQPPAQLLLLAAITMAAPAAVFSGYILLALRLQGALERPHFSLLLRRAMAALLGCSTLWLALG